MKLLVINVLFSSPELRPSALETHSCAHASTAESVDLGFFPSLTRCVLYVCVYSYVRARRLEPVILISAMNYVEESDAPRSWLF